MRVKAKASVPHPVPPPSCTALTSHGQDDSSRTGGDAVAAAHSRWFLPDFLESLAGDHAQETSESARKQEGSLATLSQNTGKSCRDSARLLVTMLFARLWSSRSKNVHQAIDKGC